MAGIRWRAIPPEFLTGTSRITVLQIVAPANQGVQVEEWGISFKDASPSDTPIYVELMYQSNAPAGSTPLTMVKGNPNDSSAIQTTANYDFAGSTQPTDTTAAGGKNEVQPNGGGIQDVRPQGKELYIPPGQRLSIVVTATTTCKCTPYAYGVE